MGGATGVPPVPRPSDCVTLSPTLRRLRLVHSLSRLSRSTKCNRSSEETKCGTFLFLGPGCMPRRQSQTKAGPHPRGKEHCVIADNLTQAQELLWPWSGGRGSDDGVAGFPPNGIQWPPESGAAPRLLSCPLRHTQEDPEHTRRNYSALFQ